MKNKKEQNKKLIPRLRFPEFRESGEWVTKQLKNIAPLQRGFDLPSSELELGDIPVVYSNGIQKFHSKFMAEAPGLVTGRSGTIGKLHFIENGKYWPHNTTLWVTDFKGNKPKFIFYFFHQLNFEHFATGSGVPTLNRNNIHASKGAIPATLPEQQRIANFLSSLDDLIEAEEEKLSTLQEYKKGLMQQLFPRDDEAVPRLRFPEFKNAGEWERKRLGSVCKMKAGQFIAASQICELPKKGHYKCYGGHGLRGYVKNYNYSGQYSLIGRQGAHCGNVKRAKGKFYATEHALVVTANEKTNYAWLYYCLIRLDLNKYATGQAQPGLSVDVLEQVRCSMPPSLSEQQRIADFLSSLDDQITAQASRIETLKAHKKGLMQQLFPHLNQ